MLRTLCLLRRRAPSTTLPQQNLRISTYVLYQKHVIDVLQFFGINQNQPPLATHNLAATRRRTSRNVETNGSQQYGTTVKYRYDIAGAAQHSLHDAVSSRGSSTFVCNIQNCACRNNIHQEHALDMLSDACLHLYQYWLLSCI